MSRLEVPHLFEVISSLPKHGHRSWRVADADQLDAILAESRISPENDVWSLGFEDGRPIGYSLTEPELNIGRIVVGCAATDGAQEVHRLLLSDAIARAEDLCGDDPTELHIAIQQAEPDYVTRNVELEGFLPLRDVVKMSAAAADLRFDATPDPIHDVTVRGIRLNEPDDVAAVTDLHNLCFEGSWGFSPNTADEIQERVSNDYEIAGEPPIIVAERTSDSTLLGYVWLTMYRADGRIEMIGVSPDARGRGLGRHLFDVAVKRLIDRGATTIGLDVDSQNEAAVHLYRAANLDVASTVRYHGRDA